MYSDLDKLIATNIAAGRGQFNELFAGAVRGECERLARELGGDSFRILDRRLQAMRKAEKIKYDRKTGWSIKGQ